MKLINFLVFFIFLSGCSAFSPIGYIEKQECSIGEQFSFKPECFGGYSSTVISDNKFLVTFEGNESTNLQRATDFAILHCSELALSANLAFISIEIVKRDLVTSVTASNGNATTSMYPMCSIYCNITNRKADDNIDANNINLQLKSKYQVLN